MADQATKTTRVWRSTEASVEAGTFSVLAAAEVAVAVAAYWAFAIYFQTQAHLWASIAVAPLLLLRSDASIALGVKWFEQYIDYTFALADMPKNIFRSGQLWAAILVSLVATMFAASVLAHLWLQAPDGATTFLLSFACGYVASQIGLAITIAGSAKGLAAIVQKRTTTGVVGSMLVAATAIGLQGSGASVMAVMAAVIPTMMLTVIGVIRGPTTLAAAVAGARAEERGDARGIAIMRIALETAPLPIAIYAPGFYFGGWIRSIGTRIAATACHIWLGILAIPDNWWRTLFVVDLMHPPELVPGYTRSDFFTLSYFFSRIRHSDSATERFVCMIAYVILYVPGYLYRLTIKSTCWFYFPLVYVVRTPRLATMPTFLRDILWREPREWGRRFLAVLTIAGLIVANLPLFGASKVNLPAVFVSPLEYMFLIDLIAIKPWQWFCLASAAITLLILAFVGQYRIILDHVDNYKVLTHAASRYAWWLEHAMRLRNVSTSMFFLIALVHVVLWKTSVRLYLPIYIRDSLYALYGNALP